jgi:hypothetical protein
MKSSGDSLAAGRAAPAGTLARCAAKHQTQKEWCVSRGKWLWLASAVINTIRAPQSAAERRRDQPNEVVISPTHIFDAIGFSLVMQE